MRGSGRDIAEGREPIDNWEPVGSPITVEMGPKVCAGLAVTAGNRDGSRIHTATFDHVSISGRAPDR